MDGIERSLAQGVDDERVLKRLTKEVSAVRSGASECVAKTEPKVKRAAQDLSILGKPTRGEAAAAVQQRSLLTREKERVEERLATCRLLMLRSGDALAKIAEQQNHLVAKRLFTRGATFFALLWDNWDRRGEWVASTKAFVQAHSGIERISFLELAMLLTIPLIGVVAGGFWRKQLKRYVRTHRWDRRFSGQFNRAVVATGAHYAPHFLASLAAALLLYFTMPPVEPVPLIKVAAYALPAYFFAVITIHVFLAPKSVVEPLLAIPPEIARSLVRRLKGLLPIMFVGYLLFATLLAQRLPAPALLLARGVFAIAFLLSIVWVIWLLDRVPGYGKTHWLRVGLILILIAALLAELAGFRNLSAFILRAVTGTLIALAALWLVKRLLAELFDGLDRGTRPWHRRLRRALNLKPGARVPALSWVRALVAISIWAVFALAVARIWGLSAATMQRMEDLVVGGFRVGSLTIYPLRIVLALATFALLYAFSGWLRARLDRRWLAKTPMEPGAREALVSITGYAGAVIAIVAGLAVAGLEFGNLAIIAGALSVGVGFGLQNIVNNFVSGLILLFERPIKRGDWIVVGDIEGYVKSIRIRSTQIQTFDRADVIVPNSELISGKVTNWMLHDPRGRVRVPMGVAYGSDTQKVKQILLDVAKAHPEVIDDGSMPAPTVLFREFGDSSLNFELRAFVRHIDSRLQVISDLNFAIDAAFREYGIEIPFPQRDIHVRGVPESMFVPGKAGGEDAGEPV